MGDRKQPTPAPRDAIKSEPPPAPPVRMLFGMPIVESELHLGMIGVRPVRIRVIASTPTGPVRFIVEDR